MGLPNLWHWGKLDLRTERFSNLYFKVEALPVTFEIVIGRQSQMQVGNMYVSLTLQDDSASLFDYRH
jgi:hypothetical protein